MIGEIIVLLNLICTIFALEPPNSEVSPRQRLDVIHERMVHERSCRRTQDRRDRQFDGQAGEAEWTTSGPVAIASARCRRGEAGAVPCRRDIGSDAGPRSWHEES